MRRCWFYVAQGECAVTQGIIGLIIEIIAGIIGGAVLTLIVGLIRNMMRK